MTTRAAGPPGPRRPAPFRPHMALALVYLFGFFGLYCLLLVAPELLDVLATVPPGPEQHEVAEQVAREAVRPRLLPALLLAMLTTGLGGYFQVLPGFRAPE